MTKTSDVIDGLNEGLSTREIMERVGCSKQLITQCRKKLKDTEEPEDDEITDEEQKDFDDSFVKKVKITPDPATLTEPKKEERIYEFTCGSCKHDWSTKSKERVTSCPSCGVEFE